MTRTETRCDWCEAPIDKEAQHFHPMEERVSLLLWLSIVSSSELDFCNRRCFVDWVAGNQHKILHGGEFRKQGQG